ncbi:hypothetical protein TNIN_407321 [Trichonephila inaurata madagascariensis]|uniref:Uncharacterized protein n=1 Tax=Trichonephila inaurata madagascariensis TaxID=2747483 RepID=A0A8X6M803_9ARAC|nr:hypothetical protein TNIN_407321 [Trichonephila inaurata madagascariensis]
MKGSSTDLSITHIYLRYIYRPSVIQIALLDWVYTHISLGLGLQHPPHATDCPSYHQYGLGVIDCRRQGVPSLYSMLLSSMTLYNWSGIKPATTSISDMYIATERRVISVFCAIPIWSILILLQPQLSEMLILLRR